MSALRRLSLVAVLAAGCVSCSTQTRCTVSNDSSETLTHVVVSGSSFSTPVPDLPPGSSRTVSLAPRGEEGAISVAFRVQGREVRHTKPAYFEATGYEVRVTVGPELAVTTDVGLSRPGLPGAAPSRSPGAR